MKANVSIEKMKQFAGQGFVSSIVVAALVGERRNISPISALRLRLGRLVWGTNTGLSKGGQPVELPDEIFYEIADRRIDTGVENQVFQNLVRAQMVVVEQRLLKGLMIFMFLLSAGVMAIYGWTQVHAAQVQNQKMMQFQQQRQ